MGIYKDKNYLRCKCENSPMPRKPILCEVIDGKIVVQCPNSKCKEKHVIGVVVGTQN